MLERFRYAVGGLGERWLRWLPPEYQKQDWEHPLDYFFTYFWPIVTVVVLACLFLGVFLLIGVGLIRLIGFLFSVEG